MIAYKMPNDSKIYQIYEKKARSIISVEKYLCKSARVKPWVAFLFSLKLVSTARKMARIP